MLEYCILFAVAGVCLFFRHYPKLKEARLIVVVEGTLYPLLTHTEERRTPVVRVGGVHARTAL